jgi:tungstate transport system substrate-binding protein
MKHTSIFFTLFVILIFLTMSFSACTQASDSPSESQAAPENSGIILATTTSTQDSGLLDLLVPIFEEDTGYIVKVIAVGTGQALKMGEEGNADSLLVHAPSSEMVLVDNGDAVDRRLIMHNDFIIVGPPADPAGIAGLASPKEALAQVAANEATFVSRGDDSGTHKKEQKIWQATGMEPSGEWYLETGQGMGASLRVASEKAGYLLTDRATYLAQQQNLDLDIMIEGDPSLLNVYHVMMVNPEKWPKVNEAGAQAWADFLSSAEGQEMIGEFGQDKFGQPLFFPDAGKSEAEMGLE